MENEKTYKTSRILYIVEAMIEYLISLLIGGAYLAKVTSYIGMSDTLTGILTSFVSLGCGFQIIAIFLADKYPVKCWVTLLHTINQLCFSLIYLVPFIKLAKEWKIVMFIAFLLLGYIINNVVNSPKINWYMSLGEDKKRGRFTANKEMVSLLGGMVFSYFMGSMIDHFEEQGDMQTAFIVGGLTGFVLCCLHTATLLFSKEKPVENTEKVSVWKEIKELLKDKTLFKVVLISVLWNIAHYVTTPFLATYQTKELDFTTKFASIVVMAGSFFRILCSKPLGRYADKHSFTKMLIICYIVEALSFGLGVFIVPSNGKVMYTLHHLLYVGGMAGINLPFGGVCGGWRGAAWLFAECGCNPACAWRGRCGDRCFGTDESACACCASSPCLFAGAIRAC